jgi:hypothetical protein
MVHIDKNSWLKETFAEIQHKQDVLRQPQNNYLQLSGKESEGFRQTQVFPSEVVQVLAHHDDFSLIKKFEGTFGWIFTNKMLERKNLTQTSPIHYAQLSPSDFFASFEGTPYYWGGLSKEGIDCSGFTQLYYLQVHGLIIPKYSQNQRKLGPERELHEIKDHDLIFCSPKIRLESNHVGVYYENLVWHSGRKSGVVGQKIEDFEMNYKLESVVNPIVVS